MSTLAHDPAIAAFQRALAKFDDNQTLFANAIATSQQRISYLVRKSRPLPAELVLAVERETGISRHELRPDIYPLQDEAA